MSPLLEASNGSSGGGDISQALINGQGSQVSHIPATMDDIPSDYSSAFSSSLSSSTDITDTESDDSTQIKQIAKKIKKKTTRSTIGSKKHSKNLIPPVQPAEKMCDIFIGNTRKSTTCKDIKKQLRDYANVRVESTDIEELFVKANRKAFKVSVPANKAKDAMSVYVWGKQIKAERFIQSKSKGSVSKQNNRPNENNKNGKKHSSQQKSFRPKGPGKSGTNANFGPPMGFNNWAHPLLPNPAGYWNQQPQWLYQGQFGY